MAEDLAPAGAVPPPVECATRPQVCTLEYAPVCGCDGRTYSNDCERRSAGISKRYDGECVSSDTVVVGEGESCEGRVIGPRRVCAEGLFCERISGTCGRDDRPGTCRSRPEICTQQYAPVCGCDGKTYGNDCHRRSAGVSFDHRGECMTRRGGLGESCGGLAGTACQQGLVCDQRPGSCDLADVGGTCVAAPGNACTRIYSPVCGCDGRTYSNDCERLQAGAPKLHDGECKPTTTLLQRGEWGGERIALSVRDPNSGGSLRFDCGSGVIYGPLLVNADGTFKWSGNYSRGGGPDVSTSAPVPVREVWFSGRVSNNTMHLQMETDWGIMASFTLHFGIMATFNQCL